MTARLPLSVIGGYLGAGKTTLINRLLAAPHGRRLLVMVNDFGAINIDADLLISASEDTIALSNGCVCCAMAGDLFQAIGAVLDRPLRPDHLVIEASGISDPARIATLARAEPDLAYAGILTVVDGTDITTRLADPLIADQIAGQIRVADMLAIAKAPADDPGLRATLAKLSPVAPVSADRPDLVAALLFDTAPAAPATATPPVPEAGSDAPHPAYVAWSDPMPTPRPIDALRTRLAQRPAGVFRIKGVVPDTEGQRWEVQIVGRQTDLTPAPAAAPLGLVAIALAPRASTAEIEAWWRA